PAGFRLPKSIPHQGVLAKRAAVPLHTLDDLVKDALGNGAQSGKKLLVLDSIQDPGNLGSILRTALAAGFNHVVMTRERSAPLGGTVARTSAGAVSHLHICQATNLAAALEFIKEAGFWVYGAVVAGEGVDSLYETDLTGAVCVVIGSEGKGIRPLVQKKCDHLVTIPMESTFNSLNAAVAAGVFMFEVGRQQGSIKKC
ncbi:MAG: 23S rRNA (guanosine(2251)-2'-O)-methyltransferase RlmB, partial [Desulfobacterales bacterium]